MSGGFWHGFGTYPTDGPLAGLWVGVTLGPTDRGPDDPDMLATLQKGIPAPLPESMGELHLPYLRSFDHEPSDQEKDDLEPEEGA